MSVASHEVANVDHRLHSKAGRQLTSRALLRLLQLKSIEDALLPLFV